MPTREEIVRSLTGAWEIFLDRPDAMRRFDVSVRGFWRSFGALFLVVPFYAVSALSERAVAKGDAILAANFSDAAFIFDKAVALCVDWVALPLLLALLATRLGITRTYPAFIIARNWASVLSIVPFGLISLLYVLDILGSDTADVLSLATVFVVLRYNYLIARRALDVGVGFAAALVVSDFALSMLIGAVIDLTFGLYPQ